MKEDAKREICLDLAMEAKGKRIKEIIPIKSTDKMLLRQKNGEVFIVDMNQCQEWKKLDLWIPFGNNISSKMMALGSQSFFSVQNESKISVTKRHQIIS